MLDDPKHIVLTGVSRGLGLALATGFISRGDTVAGCARSEQSIADLRRRWGPPSSFDVVDVASDEQVKEWAARVLRDKGSPHLLVNNAALINRNMQLWDVPADEFSQIIDVNIKGVVNVIRHFGPAMIAEKRGVIVNLSSGWGRSTAPEVAPYCATKWAIEGLTRSMAQELPGGLAAVPVNPGIIDTDMLRSCFGESSSEYPDPAAWAESAVPFFLGLGPADNGKPLTVPGR